MTDKIFCKKLKETLEPLPSAPMPGALGKQVYENISKQAWGMWLAHQTMLINEYRLNLTDPNARKFLLEEMDKFLFS